MYISFCLVYDEADSSSAQGGMSQRLVVDFGKERSAAGLTVSHLSKTAKGGAASGLVVRAQNQRWASPKNHVCSSFVNGEEENHSRTPGR